MLCYKTENLTARSYYVSVLCRCSKQIVQAAMILVKEVSWEGGGGKGGRRREGDGGREGERKRGREGGREGGKTMRV